MSTIWYFNARTGEYKALGPGIVYTLADFEHVFETKDALTREHKRALMNQCYIEGEVFRVLPSCEQLSVSNFGRVKRHFKNGATRILSPYLMGGVTGGEYVAISATLNGKKSNYRISKLVAEAFPIAGTGTLLYHLNRNKWDNRTVNLKYVTRLDVVKCPQRTLRQPVLKLDVTTREVLMEYESIREAGRQEFLSYESIRGCVTGQRKTAGGFKWRYAERPVKKETKRDRTRGDVACD